MGKRNKLKPAQIDDLVNDLQIQQVLSDQVRQVRWLYNNSNKYTMVYEERLVWLIVHKLENRIKELENQTK